MTERSDLAANPYFPAPAHPGTGDVEYQQLYRAGRDPSWVWSLLGTLAVAFCFLIVNAVVAVIGFAVYFLATGVPQGELEDKITALADTDLTTPTSLLFVNLVLILAIPEVWAATRLFNGLRPGWVTSVAPRVRWKWLAVSFGVSILTLGLSVFLGALLPASSDGEELTGGVNDFTTTSLQFLLVIVLLTPLQAIAEEYVFRGYLTQAFGGITAHLWVSRGLAVVVPAVLFALAHGVQDFPVFVDRLAFGLTAGILVVATGGLEAGIAQHIVNNVLAFGLALLVGDITTVLDPQGGSWWDVLLTVVKSVLFVGLSVWAARTMGLQTRADRTVLDASVGRV
ncbi:CPBP family intramembrane glutamic endopeptidase [Nocardioides sp.]|uniref:CPBP family intramembrane glutamic endopeptidase n=1 Tax=Nocardioides sp. TaxID=35761 RepID=UPI0027282B44|nr:CPBP family intramembrane glutamic endopeptidase [Nocardioides sp.]MDO9454886.1 CPBP family intramembrane metalloprotease [Nocardioides sp.]